MSVDKFKFVSPGVFIDEIDESGIPSLPERILDFLVNQHRAMLPAISGAPVNPRPLLTLHML